MFCAIVFAAVVGTAFAGCPTVTTKEDFDTAKFAGDWFEIQRIPRGPQSKSTCVRASYEEIVPGELSAYQVATRPNGDFASTTGSLTTPDPSSPGRLVLDIPGEPKVGYWVLDTDYTSYSAVYSCEDYGGLIIEFGWLFSRKKTLCSAATESAMEKFTQFGIDISQFEKFYQGEDCVYDNNGDKC